MLFSNFVLVPRLNQDRYSALVFFSWTTRDNLLWGPTEVWFWRNRDLPTKDDDCATPLHGTTRVKDWPSDQGKIVNILKLKIRSVTITSRFTTKRCPEIFSVKVRVALLNQSILIVILNLKPSTLHYRSTFLKFHLATVDDTYHTEFVSWHVDRFYFCQTLGLVLRLRVDFVLPLSQEEQEQEEQEQEQPLTKIYQLGVY